MSEKRRDRRNRVLRNGESQQKDGKYRYTYVDLDGKTKCVYSWRLEPIDPVPPGKKWDEALRDKIKEINRNLELGIIPNGGDLTVEELVKKYVATKTGVRASTRAGYKTVMNILAKEAFAKNRIDRIKLSDAKEFLIKLQQEDKRSYSSIHTIRGVLKPAFQMALDDDLIRKNPFDFPLMTVLVNDAVTREAITHDEKRKYLKFVKEDPHFSQYYDAIYILFFTGMRISEFCGLTLRDINFKERTINIDHQLQRASNMQYIIQDTKTAAGTRVIPMDEEVYQCFKRIIANRKAPKVEPIVDGYTGFLFLDKNGKPMVALHWEKYMEHIVEKYNSIYKVQMPKVTPHVCRHTYCSHMASSGFNPKHLQYLMGHSDIGVTLNTYTHIEFDKGS